MSWPIREELKPLKVDIPIKLVEKVDEAVEFLKARGREHATRSHVVEYVINEHLGSRRQVMQAFRDWKEANEDK